MSWKLAMVHHDGRTGHWDWATGEVVCEDGTRVPHPENLDWKPQTRWRKDRVPTARPLPPSYVALLRLCLNNGSVRSLARDIGVSTQTIGRAVSGERLQQAKRLRIERWLDDPKTIPPKGGESERQQ